MRLKRVINTKKTIGFLVVDNGNLSNTK